MARRLACKILFFILLATIPFLEAFAQGNLSYKQYFLNKLNGSKIGYSFVERKKVDKNGLNLIITQKYSEQKYKHFGLPIDVIQDVKFYENEKLEPVALEVNNITGDKVNSYTANFLPNNRVIIKYNEGAKNRVKNIVLQKDLIFPAAINKLFSDNKDEGVVEYSTVDVEDDFRVVDIKAVKQREQGKYNIYVDLLPNVKNELWLNDEGYIRKEVSSIFGLEKIAVDKGKILPDVNDIFQKFIIPSDGKIDKIQDIREITYKVFLNGYPQDDILESSENQRIIQFKDDIAYLKVKMGVRYKKEFKYPPSVKGLGKYLSESELLDFDKSPAIKAVVDKEISSKSTSTYELVRNFQEIVRERIKDNSGSSEIRNASSVLSSKKGNSIEKAILFASFLRRAAIPAKIVAGMKYINSPQPSFVYGCWVDAFIGSWESFDVNSESDIFHTGHVALKEVDINAKDIKQQLLLEIPRELSKIRISILDFSLLRSKDSLVVSEKLNAEFSSVGFLDYIRHSGMDAAEVGITNTADTNRSFIKLKDIESKKYVSKAVHYYVNGDIDRALINFERVFELAPVNDDYLNVSYAKKLASLGFFSMAKNRLANISDHKIWSGKIEKFYKMHLPKILPDYNDEKKLAKIMSQIDFSIDQVDEKYYAKELSKRKYKKSDYVNYLLSKMYFAKGDEKRAYKYIKKALNINASNILYHMHKLHILTSKDKYSGALKEINWLLDNMDDSSVKYGLKLHKHYILYKKYWLSRKKNFHFAKFLLLSNQNRKAKSLINSELKKRLKKDELYVLLGNLYFKMNKPELAYENFMEALDLNKRNSEAFEGIGDIKRSKYKPGEALMYYSKALKNNKKSAGLVLKVANCNRDLLREDEALSYYFDVLKLDSENYEAIYNIIQVKGKYGEDSDLTYAYKQILNINPDYVPAWFGLVKIALLNKNVVLARKYLKPVSYIDKLNPEYYYYSGLIELLNENYVYARRDFNKALSLDPDFAKARFELEKLQ